MGTGNHFSAGRSLGNATIAPAPVVPVAGTDLSPPLPTTVSDVGRNGLRLKVWPQLVNGLQEYSECRDIVTAILS